MKKIDWKQLITFVLFTELVGIVSSLLAGNISQTYQHLNKPPLAPPGWLFGIIWPILYALIGISIYLVYKSKCYSHEKYGAFVIYLVQLAFNFMWTLVFFRFHAYWGALIVIIILDILVFLMLVSFKKISKTAAILIIPYQLWILFATYLNIGFALLN